MLRFDRRTDNQQELARIGADINELAPSPSQKDGTIRADANRAHIDCADFSIGRRHIDTDNSSVNLRLWPMIAVEIDLHTAAHEPD